MSTLESDSVSRSDCQPWRDEETLRYYYHQKGLPSRIVANHLGVGKRTVLSWMERHGIERRSKSEANSTDTPELLTDAKALRREIVEKERALSDIADGLGVGQSTVSRWASEHGITTRPNSKETVPVECRNCGETFHRIEWYVENRTNHFCDRSCLGEYRSEHWNGDAHPIWNGGLTDYGKGWNREKKRAVRERDGHECQSCGMPQSKHLEVYGERLHVHHIVKAREFDDAGKRNAMENLIALCGSCHVKWEGIPLRPVRVTSE